MNDTGDEANGLQSMHRLRRAVVVVDMVESVRLMQSFEAQTIERWRRFVAGVRHDLTTRHEGRVVKSLGDGLLLEFPSAHQAAGAALDLLQLNAAAQQGHGAVDDIHLRIGAHIGEVVADDIDIYGAGVNLAARLAGLAEPGGIVVSADFRDALVPGLDPDADDMGECQVKNLAGTVRAFALRGGNERPTLPRFDTYWGQRPAIAVLPFEASPVGADAGVIADVLVDQMIHDLSHAAVWRVISRLSTASLRGRCLGLADVARHLKVDFVVSGRCHASAGGVRVNAEVAEVQTSSVVWSGIFQGSREEVLEVEGGIGARIVAAMCKAIFEVELQRARSRALPTLTSHTLLLAGVALMHRLSREDFLRARDVLDELCRRHPRACEPHAWAAKWHVLAVVQGWCADTELEIASAREAARRALDERSDHALGLAVDGLIAGFLLRDLDASQQRYDAAIAANPNEGLAWLFQSALHAYRDRGEQAELAARNAQRLSPLDPIRYFYDSFSAHAMLAAGHHADAIALAERSLRANCTHLPTFRTLAIAQMLGGQPEAARKTVARLLNIDPHYRVSKFVERYPGRGSRFAALSAEALAGAGLPA